MSLVNYRPHTPGLFPALSESSVFSPFNPRYFPFWETPTFPLGITSGPFGGLLEKGWFQTSHFLTLDVWSSVSTLKQPDGRYGLDFWRALQLCHFLHTLCPTANFLQHLTMFESYCEDSGSLPLSPSKMYSLVLLSPPEDFDMPCLSKWERDLDRSFMPDQCRDIIHLTLKSSVCMQ